MEQSKVKRVLDDEDGSNKYGYRPTGYHYMPRKMSRVITVRRRELYLIQKQTADSCCGTSTEMKYQKAKGKEEEIIEVVGPNTDRYTETSKSFYELLKTNPPLLNNEKRCVDTQCELSENRTVSVQNLLTTEQKSSQYPSNEQCETIPDPPDHHDPALEDCPATVTEQEEPKDKVEVEASPPNRTCNKRTQTKSINKQFPCPCLSPNVRNDEMMCDANFYKWWAMQMAKDREAAMLAREVAAKRYALSYPDEVYPACGFVLHCQPAGAIQEEYREKLIKEEIYEKQYKTPKQDYYSASPPKDPRQEKRWSFVKTLNNAFKTITFYSCYK